MADFLEIILSNEISTADITKWLLSSENTFKIGENVVDFTQGQFVCQFTIFLREQASNFLQLPQSVVKEIHKVDSTQQPGKSVKDINRKGPSSSKSPLKSQNRGDIRRPRRIQLFTNKQKGNESNSSEDASRSILENTPPKSADIIGHHNLTLHKNEMSPIPCVNTSNIFFQSPLPSKWNTSSPINPKNSCFTLMSPVLNIERTPNSINNQSRKESPRNRLHQLGDFMELLTVTPETKNNKWRYRSNQVISPSNDIGRNKPVTPDHELQTSVKSLNVETQGTQEIETKQSIEQTTEPVCTPTKLPVKQIPVDPKLVENTEQLNKLSTIYSTIITNYLSHNIMLDLHFVVSLLSVQNIENITSDCAVFSSIHNCAYFSVRVLWLIRDILVMLNNSTLKILYESNHIECLNNNLKNYLYQLYEEKCNERNVLSRSISVSGEFLGNISFQCDTDNKENFPSSESFHSFRKQRDMFFEILNTWELNHTSTSWSFSSVLGHKIRSLLSLCNEPINMFHFARLFRSQLVNSCLSNNQSYDDMSEEILQLLPSVDMSKISLLQARLTSSHKRYGPCPTPEFTGSQEFFKDFILYSDNYLFHKHLKDSLCCEVLTMNETDLVVLDIDNEPDTSIDYRTQRRYLDCLSTLSLLAKFLGFIEFLPFNSSLKYSEHILSTQASIRNHIQPAFDIASCLKKSVLQQKLTLTIPWLVTFLAMMDQSSYRQVIYQDICLFLIYIYKNLNINKPIIQKYKNINWRLNIIKPEGQFLLRIFLGWFFNINHYLSELFYSLDSQNVKILNDLVEDIVQVKTSNPTKLHLQKCDMYTTPDKKEHRNVSEVDLACYKGLDMLKLIDENVMYTICPFLNELKYILTDNEYSLCNAKYVRPITTKLETSKTTATKQLEICLEENFLHNQLSSTRKAVEFVAERVTSSCLKHLVGSVIPVIKNKAIADINMLKDELKKLKRIEVQSKFDSEVSRISQSCYKEISESCEVVLWKFVIDKSTTALDSVLGEDVPNTARKTCFQITAKMSGERVMNWLHSNLTLKIIQNDLRTEGKKMLKTVLSNNATVQSTGVHKSDAISRLPEGLIIFETCWTPLQALTNIRRLMWRIMEREYPPVCDEEVRFVLDGTLSVTSNPTCLSASAEKTILLLLLDLLSVINLHYPHLLHHELILKLIHVLKMYNMSELHEGKLERLFFSSRTVHLLENNCNSLHNLSYVFVVFINENMITYTSARNSLLYYVEVEQVLNPTIRTLLSEMLARCRSLPGSDEFVNLLSSLL